MHYDLEVKAPIDWGGEDTRVDVHPATHVGVDLGVADRAAPALEDL